MIRKTRYQTYRDATDDNGDVVSVPDRVVTDVPGPGVRFTVLEAPEAKVPSKDPYDGPPATIQLTADEDFVAGDGA